MTAFDWFLAFDVVSHFISTKGCLSHNITAHIKSITSRIACVVNVRSRPITYNIHVITYKSLFRFQIMYNETKRLEGVAPTTY